MSKRVLALFFVVLTTSSCAINQPEQFHAYAPEPAGISQLTVKMTGYATPELDMFDAAKLENMGFFPGGGWVCGGSLHVQQPEPTISFRITGVTEHYVPLTNERKHMLYHIKLSPRPYQPH